MNEVAEAAGVTKPVLYQHFPSKRELYLELLSDVGTHLTSRITEASRAAPGPRERTVAGLEAYFTHVYENEAAFRLLFGSGARRDEEFASAVRAVEADIASNVAALLTSSIDEDRRQLLAHGIIGLAEGVCRHWLAGDNRDSLDLDPTELAEQVGELLWGGLRDLGRTS